MACRNRGHFPGGIVWRLFWSGDWHPHDRRAEFISKGDIRRVVALKNFLALCMRGIAVLVLVLQGNVNWKYGAPMAVGGLIGGYIGGTISHRANRTLVRSIAYCDRFRRIGVFFLESVRPAVSRIGVESAK